MDCKTYIPPICSISLKEARRWGTWTPKLFSIDTARLSSCSKQFLHLVWFLIGVVSQTTVLLVFLVFSSATLQQYIMVIKWVISEGLLKKNNFSTPAGRIYFETSRKNYNPKQRFWYARIISMSSVHFT